MNINEITTYNEYLDGDMFHKNYSPNTKKVYLNAAKKLLVYIKQTNNHFPENEDESISFIKWCKEQYKLSDSSLNLILKGINNFYAFLLKNQIIKVNSFVNLQIKIERNSDTEKIDSVMLSDDNLHKLIENATYDLKDAIILCMSFGLRISELKNISKNDLFVKENKLFLKIRHSKNNAFRISVSIFEKYNDIILDIIRKWNPESIKVNSLQVRMNRLAKRLNIKVHFHSLRHYYATKFMDLGGDLDTLSSLLGHSSIKTTRIYGKITTNRIEKVVNRILT